MIAASGPRRSLMRRGGLTSGAFLLSLAGVPHASRHRLSPHHLAVAWLSLTGPSCRRRMARGPSPMYRVGVDIGGTFTDIVFLDEDGRLHTKKVSSSVDDYARAIVDGLREVFRDTGLTGHDIAEVLHGTTVASNANLELRGARTGLITTKGFRDVLEIRRLRMPRLYDLTWEKPPTLVERRLRMEVSERIDVRGAVQQPLDETDVERALDRLLAQRIDALSVCLLNAWANPVH